MALTVETGAGLPDADSYLSVADATTYHANMKGATSEWTSASSDQQEIALRQATQYLDTKYRGRWRGTRTNQTQALAWPRACAEDDDGFVFDADIIPEPLKDATAEAAYRAISTALMPDVTDNGSVKIESVKVGPITRSREYLGGKSIYTSFGIVDTLMASLVNAGNRMFRG